MNFSIRNCHLGVRGCSPLISRSTLVGVVHIMPETALNAAYCSLLDFK